MTKKKRPIRIEGDVAYVTLTKGMVAVIDASMVHLIDGGNWCISGGYAARNAPSVNGKQHTIIMHRVLTDAPDGMLVDHIDGNTMNNRLANLRLCTKSQNAANRGSTIINTSGFKGVTASGKRWMAMIMANGRSIYLGTRDTPEEAHQLYAEAAVKYFGEFARTA